MPSIDDWAAKAAARIVDEVSENVQWRNRRLVAPSQDHIAAIIATFAEPLMQLARDSRREHFHSEEDSWDCCGRCAHGCKHQGDEPHEHDASCFPRGIFNRRSRTIGVCDCGADAWNARIDAVLRG